MQQAPQNPNVVNLTEVDFTVAGMPYRVQARTQCAINGLTNIRVIRSRPSNTAKIVVNCDGASVIEDVIDDPTPAPSVAPTPHPTDSSGVLIVKKKK